MSETSANKNVKINNDRRVEICNSRFRFIKQSSVGSLFN